MERRHSIEGVLHPGLVFKEKIFLPSKLTVEKAAECLAVTRPTLSRLINGRSSLTANMALRISYVFGGHPEYWLQLQLQYDLAKAKKDFKDYDKLRRTQTQRQQS